MFDVGERGGRGRRFSREEPPQRPSDPAVRKANLRRIAGLFSPYRWRLGVVLALILVSAGLGVVPAFLLRGVLEAIQVQDTRKLAIGASGMIVIAVVTGAIGVWQTLLSNQVGQAVMHDLRTAVFRHLQGLSLAFTRTRTARCADLERHRRCAERRHVDGDVDHLQRDHGARDDGRHVLLSWELRCSHRAHPDFVLLTRRVGNERGASRSRRRRRSDI
jgi:ATP-binding cassette subfamily B protein